MMTFDEMRQLLSSSKEVDLRTFDLEGGKTLANLHNEIETRDVTLQKNSAGRIVRSATSVRVLIRFKDMALLETKRYYTNNGRTIPKLQDFSISETMKRWVNPSGEIILEKPLSTAIRGILEELEIMIQDPAELKEVPVFGEHFVHESTVYPGVISDVIIYRFEWHIPTLFHREGKINKENGVNTFVKWFSSVF